MPRSRWLQASLLVAAGLAGGTSLASGQADSMGQGEAAINVRSDVKLGIKGTGGTPGARLEKLGQSVGEELGEIRTCYRKLVATAPEVAGGLRFKLSLAQGQKPLVEVTSGQGSADELIKCVSRVLREARYQGVERPAAAMLSLEFDNTRARGQLAMNAKQAEIARVAVQDDASGGKQASWSTQAGEVSFKVQTDAGAPDSALELIMRGFHDGYAAFLDCRRKCEKGGVSPEGDIQADLELDTRGKARVKLGAISVTHQRAPVCGAKAFGRVKFDKPPATLRAHVTVHFAK